MASDSSKSGLSRRSYVAIAVLLCLAAWLAADSIGWPVPAFGVWWPCFAIVGGVASIVEFFVGSRRSVSLTRGLIGIGIGAYLLLLTTGQFAWNDLRSQWPLLLALIAFAGLGGWFAAGMRGVGSGVVGFLALGFFFTAAYATWEVAWTLPPTAVWAVTLVALAAVIFRGKKRAKTDAGNSSE